MQPDQIVRRSDRAVFRELADDEGGVLLHLDTGAYHGINPVGVVIWNAIGESSTFEDLVAAVRSRVDDAPEELTSDVRAFLEDLTKRDLLTLS